MKKTEKEKRKEKKDRKRKWLKTQEQQIEENAETGDGDGDEGAGDDWDELAREERMAKKLKKGDITQGDFDMEFSGI